MNADLGNDAVRVERISKRYRIGARAPEAFTTDLPGEVGQVPPRWCGRSGKLSSRFLMDRCSAYSAGTDQERRRSSRFLARVTAPTAGAARIAGRVAALLQVGTGFHPELAGRGNVTLSGTILGMTRHEITQVVDEIFAFADIDAFLDTPVKRYSTGMYMRLAFSVAAHMPADVMLIDEVLSVGDAAFRRSAKT